MLPKIWFEAGSGLRFHDRGLQCVRLGVVQAEDLAMLEPVDRFSRWRSGLRKKSFCPPELGLRR